MDAVCGTARFFIHSRRDQYNAGPFKSIIVAIYDIDFGTERGAIPNVGRHCFCPLTGPVDQNNFARAAADCGGHRACTAHVASSNYPDLHGCIHLWLSIRPLAAPFHKLALHSVCSPQRVGSALDSNPTRGSGVATVAASVEGRGTIPEPCYS